MHRSCTPPMKHMTQSMERCPPRIAVNSVLTITNTIMIKAARNRSIPMIEARASGYGRKRHDAIQRIYKKPPEGPFGFAGHALDVFVLKLFRLEPDPTEIPLEKRLYLVQGIYSYEFELALFTTRVLDYHLISFNIRRNSGEFPA